MGKVIIHYQVFKQNIFQWDNNIREQNLSCKKNPVIWYRVSQKQLSLYFLLHISGTKEWIYKPFVSAVS